MGPFIPPLPILSCEAAFWITTYLLQVLLTIFVRQYSQTNKSYIYPTVQSERNFYNSNAKQEATNSTIGAIRPCVNSTVEHEHLIQFPCETWQSAGTRRHQ